MVRSNKLLFHSTGPEKFATLFYAVLDMREHTLTYSNAGHDIPFLFSCGDEPVRLRSGGLMLGAFENAAYEEETVVLKPSDLLVVSSDGITEAMNPERELFGEAHLEAIIRHNRNGAPEELIEKIAAAVHTHAGTQTQSDDLTIVVMRRL